MIHRLQIADVSRRLNVRARRHYCGIRGLASVVLCDVMRPNGDEDCAGETDGSEARRPTLRVASRGLPTESCVFKGL